MVTVIWIVGAFLVGLGIAWVLVEVVKGEQGAVVAGDEGGSSEDGA